MTAQRFRKAAILIASLDSKHADALLDQFTPEEAARVRNAIMDLGEIDTQEQRKIIEEFVQQGPGRQQAVTDEAAGVELSESLRNRIGTPSPASPVPVPAPSPMLDGVAKTMQEGTKRPFRWLESIAAEDLSDLLTREHPQTAAIAVAHLPTTRALEVLAQLPPTLQADILTRIARMDQANPEILQDVEREMETQLFGRNASTPFEDSGLATVLAIVQGAENRQRRELIANLVERDRGLARHVAARTPSENAMPDTTDFQVMPNGAGQDVTINSPHDLCQRQRKSYPDNGADEQGDQSGGDPCSVPERIEFADLERLPSDELAQLLQAANRETALLALAGASHSFVQRLLTRLPAREAARFESRMQNLGPLRLTDIDMAQRQLADTAERLIEDGLISSPASNRFAAAV